MESSASSRPTRLCSLARARIAAGDYDGARSYLHQARAEAGDTTPPELFRLLADLTAQLHDFSGGVQLMEQALDAFRLAEDHDGEVVTAGDLAALLQRQGNLGRARTMIDWSLRHVAVDDLAQRARLLNIAATIASFQGRLTDALNLLAEARSLAHGRTAGWITFNLAAALINQGEHAKALEELRSAEVILQPGDGYTHMIQDYMRIWWLLAKEDFTSARVMCQDSLRRMAPDQHPIIYYPTVATLGVLFRETGDLNDAAALLNQALTVLQARNDQATVIGIWWHQAALARKKGDDQGAEERLRMALNAMWHSGYGTTLLWQPQRFAELCVWGIDRGVEVAFASWLLQNSLTSWVARRQIIRDDSADRNMATHTSEILSCAALTPREREILFLTARGLHDREIADQLRLSARTVQNHLQRCYTKLGVSGRMAALQLLLAEKETRA